MSDLSVLYTQLLIIYFFAFFHINFNSYTLHYIIYGCRHAAFNFAFEVCINIYRATPPSLLLVLLTQNISYPFSIFITKLNTKRLTIMYFNREESVKDGRLQDFYCFLICNVKLRCEVLYFAKGRNVLLHFL